MEYPDYSLKKKEGGHKCEYIPEPSPYSVNSPPLKETQGYGCAVTICWEAEDGTLVADNGEYLNRVNFCPFCGAKAPTQI